MQMMLALHLESPSWQVSDWGLLQNLFTRHLRLSAVKLKTLLVKQGISVFLQSTGLVLFRDALYLESVLGRDAPVTLERLPTAVSARRGTESDPGPSLPRATLQTTDLNAAQQPRGAGPERLWSEGVSFRTPA